MSKYEDIMDEIKGELDVEGRWRVRTQVGHVLVSTVCLPRLSFSPFRYETCLFSWGPEEDGLQSLVVDTYQDKRSAELGHRSIVKQVAFVVEAERKAENELDTTGINKEQELPELQGGGGAGPETGC
jgi:hypothetical protein